VSVEAVVFDLDGVLIDSEQAWDDARQDLVAEHGGTWTEGASRAMLGMSSKEWPAYVRDELGVGLTADEINAEVVRRLTARYEDELPVLPGAREAVARLGDRWPLALASSSNREVIDLVLDALGVTERFAVTVSSEEVGRGKPAPDVYLEAVRLLGADPSRCVAVEDSENGNPLRRRRRAARAGHPQRALPAGRRRARAGGRGPTRPRRPDGRRRRWVAA
jgi:HAD superfamily hydrolase (TIGR01509 family)